MSDGADEPIFKERNNTNNITHIKTMTYSVARKLARVAMIAMALATASQASALKPKEYPDTFMIPSRAIIASGSAENGKQLVAVLYDTENLHFSDPSAPRFLFLDRKGKIALGIGGYLKGTVQYDFDGSTDDGASLTTFDIPVPNNPAQRSQFYGNANHSTIFLQLVGHSDMFGYYSAYIQTTFQGDGAQGYGVKVKQAYMRVGYVTAGLANSTFVDGAAGTPVVDDQGPSGEMAKKNVLVRYAPRFSDHLSGAIGIEMPSVTSTFNSQTQKINQRVPDIPIYLQYEWGGGKSHVRASGLLRNMSYRDLVAKSNKFKTGWAVQLSGVFNIYDLTVFAQGAYGRGYAAYLNDLSGNDLDMVYDGTTGKMTAPKTANFEIGASYSFSPKFSLTGTFSKAMIFGLKDVPSSTYRYGQYLGVNAFYDILPDLSFGLEYFRGWRKDYSNVTGHANSIMAMMKYTF